jgi:hypothetical protein
MSRFTDLFQEPTPAPEPTAALESVEVEKVAETKTEKVSKASKKKFTMD